MIAHLPRKDGEPIELVPSLAIWRKLEKQHGGIGLLYLQHKQLHVRLDVYSTLFYECAANAGEDVTFEQVQRYIADHGLWMCHDIAGELFEDLFKAKKLVDRVEEEKSDVPLASGD